MTIHEWASIEKDLAKYLQDKDLPFTVVCDDWNDSCGNVWFHYTGTPSNDHRRIARTRLFHALTGFNQYLYKLNKKWVRFIGAVDHYPDNSSMSVAYFY